MTVLRIGMAQVNLTVGDLEGNREKILSYMEKAEARGVDLLSFPEMAITGYPPEDLLLKPLFIRENISNLRKIARKTGRMVVVVGFVENEGGLYNAAAVMALGRVLGIYRKMLLPNYGVFDEKRYFKEGFDPLVFEWGGNRFGVNICEDIWYPEGPCHQQVSKGACLILNISASPYFAGKWRVRKEILSETARAHRVYIAYNNLVGGQDELVFDGHGMVLDDQGRLLMRGRSFEEELILYDLSLGEGYKKALPRAGKMLSHRITTSPRQRGSVISIPFDLGTSKKSPFSISKGEKVALPHSVGEVYRALVLGTRDYVEKNGFSEVVIGVSGGVDSALTATIAVDALGPKRVVGVFLPSEFTSRASQEDVASLVKGLGIRLIHLSIQDLFQAYLSLLKGPFQGCPRDITEENIQARIRGNLLMALSNKFGWLVLTTGNKSEMSVGYATLYGDMAGGFAVLKDVPKMLVYRLARYRNRTLGEVIPRRTLKREPTAELRPGQRDADSIPPYPVLDPILKAYVEEDRSLSEIVRLGFDRETVKRVIELVDRSEYKRRQAPPGIKITPRAFGKDRRVPITNRFGLGRRRSLSKK